MALIKKNPNQGGFALLITLFVVMAVVTITVSIIELSMKQLELSITAKDSEIAFSAANAGMECARYLQRQASSTMIQDSTTDNPPIIFTAGSCFDKSISLKGAGAATNLDEDQGSLTHGTDFWVHMYEVEGGGVTWSNRCTNIKILAVYVKEDQPTLNMDGDDIQDYFSGWDRTKNKACAGGSECYIMQVTGYNSGCGTTGGDTLRREVLLEL